MNPFKFINLPVFAASLALGIFAVYIMDADQTRQIMVYPTPDNIDKVQYRDSTDACFVYQQTEIQCPADPQGVYRIPVQ